MLGATSDRFVPVSRERLVFVTAMSAAIGTSRFGGDRSPGCRAVPCGSRAANVAHERPDSLRAWAAAEMRRHDWRMVAEAARAIGVYDASAWIGDIDVPTTVLVTTEDKAISPLEQMRLLLAIPGRGAAAPRRRPHRVCRAPASARRWSRRACPLRPASTGPSRPRRLHRFPDRPSDLEK